MSVLSKFRGKPKYSPLREAEDSYADGQDLITEATGAFAEATYHFEVQQERSVETIAALKDLIVGEQRTHDRAHIGALDADALRTAAIELVAGENA